VVQVQLFHQIGQHFNAPAAYYLYLLHAAMQLYPIKRVFLALGILHQLLCCVAVLTTVLQQILVRN
jgi:hypothetical protein